MASSIHGLNKRNLIFLVIAVIIASAILHGRNLPVKPIAILPPRTITYTVSSGDAVTIFFGGDTMLGDAAMSLISKKGYSEPLSNVSYITSSADVAIVNLEAPVTTRGKPISAEKARLFRQHPYALTALANAGIDIFMLANNHILDYGPEGLMDTLKEIEQHKLAGSGAGLKEQEARRGIVMQFDFTEPHLSSLKVGLLSYMEMYKDYTEKYRFFSGPNSPGVAALTEDSLRQDIKSMRPLVDVLIVSPHWGDDYKPVRQLQSYFGRLAIDLGADAVIGHHSHSHQIVEIYKGRPILYSIGNFVFGSKSSMQYEAAGGEKRRFCCGMPVTVNIDVMRRAIKTVELIPVLTNNYVVRFIPRRPDTGEAHAVLEQLRRDSNINNRNFEVIHAADGPRGRIAF